MNRLISEHPYILSKTGASHSNEACALSPLFQEIIFKKSRNFLKKSELNKTRAEFLRNLLKNKVFVFCSSNNLPLHFCLFGLGFFWVGVFMCADYFVFKRDIWKNPNQETLFSLIFLFSIKKSELSWFLFCPAILYTKI